MHQSKFYLLTCFFFFNAAQAHDFFNSPDWCQGNNQSIQFIEFIGISNAELYQQHTHGVYCSIPVTEPSLFPPESSHKMIAKYISPVIINGERQHGVIDDPDMRFRAAIAYAYCACSSLNGDPEINPQTTRPKIESIDFTQAIHHSNAVLSDGVYFSCHVCVPNETHFRQ